jgi:Fe(3+) dicitrate transport protein
MQGAVRLAALALLSSAAPALAADPPADPPAEPPASPDPPAEEESPIEVQVIGERADALQKVPGSGTVIRSKEIDRAEPDDVAEVLRRVPGVTARQDPGAGGRLDIGLRGLDPGRSRRVLVLEDGVPVAINPYAEPDLYYAPPIERVRGIEVVKGSGNILFGPQTIGGVINFVTLFPPDHRIATTQIRAGERGYFQALGRYGDSFGSARFVGQLLFERSDGFREEDYATIDAFGKVAFDTGPSGEGIIKIGFHDMESASDDVGLTAAMYEEDPRRPTIAPHDRAKLRRYDISLTHEQRFNDVVTLRTLAYAAMTDRLWRRQAYDRFPIDGVFYERIVGDIDVPQGAIWFRDTNRILDRSYQYAGLEPRAELRFATGAVGHTLSVGTRILGEGAHYQERAGSSPTSEAGSLELDEVHTTLAVAGYVQDRFAFLDEHLLVTPGVRFEHARFSRTIDRQAFADGAEDVSVHGTSATTAFIPGVGMTAGIPEAHGFAGVHLGFAPPRVSSSISPTGRTIELDAERSIIYEAGVRARYKRALGADLTGFLDNFENQVVAQAGDVETELVNGGRTRHYGLESSLQGDIGALIGHGVIFDLAIRYTLMRAEFVGGSRDGNRLPYAPSHLMHATVDIGHDIGIVGEFAYGFTGDQFSDDQDTVIEDPSGRRGRIPVYHQIDVGLHYKNRETGIGVGLTAKNVADSPFVIARRPEGIFAGGFRQITASLRWDFPQEPAKEP